MKLQKFKTIKVNEIDFVISDEEIKEGDSVYNTDFKAVGKCINPSNEPNTFKILCQLKSDSPIEGVPIAEEISVEELANYIRSYSSIIKHSDPNTNVFESGIYQGFKAGYNLLNKERGYSEEEMRKSFDAGVNYGLDNEEDALQRGYEINDFTHYIQSLPTKIFLLTDDDLKPLRINNTLKFVKQ